MINTEQTVTGWVNSLTVEQMAVIYNIIDPISTEERAELDALSDDELLAELSK